MARLQESVRLGGHNYRLRHPKYLTQQLLSRKICYRISKTVISHTQLAVSYLLFAFVDERDTLYLVLLHNSWERERERDIGREKVEERREERKRDGKRGREGERRGGEPMAAGLGEETSIN